MGPLVLDSPILEEELAAPPRLEGEDREDMEDMEPRGDLEKEKEREGGVGSEIEQGRGEIEWREEQGENGFGLNLSASDQLPLSR